MHNLIPYIATTQPITAILTCDGDMTVYADGVEINRKTSSYKVPQTSTLPSGSSLLAVHSHNPNRTARILGSIHVSMTTASEGWVCTDRYYPAWNTKQFVDTSWAPAKTHGRNEFSSFPFDMVENITSTAEWIGTENDTNSLYCRFPLCPQRGQFMFSMPRIMPCISQGLRSSIIARGEGNIHKFVSSFLASAVFIEKIEKLSCT